MFGQNPALPLDRETAAKLLPFVIAVNAIQDFVGTQVSADEKAAFCGHCDKQGSCEKQGRYVGRNWCGWSIRRGVSIDEVTLEGFIVDEQNIPRGDLVALDTALGLETH